ncbi:uncharacterized protein A1O9_11449 [Exophiala aquamarina CBS 119918]|uniref:Fatty acyl-CoA reductase n=1 Tax=Exophiala aquamarina CBS 119918 TaxID=1182545 RepID=A0A072NYD8_9EURO|nr:uncharacterized protein A1O9_11449 [Exophiala aquamarina CBS 119918]KEF52606.1 hypothetical protein A1O9_11449 [Exophiala aquamarina CBS 119918]
MSASEPSMVFVTGTTGLLGKVVLEELIRHFEECRLRKVIVLLRPSNNHCAQERFFSEVVASPCFSVLRPQWHEKIEVVQGDLTQMNCGLHAQTRLRIFSEITHIINCAAAVAFDLPLIDATIANVGSAMNMLRFATECPKLQAIVTTSTSYVAPFTDLPIPPTVVPLPYPTPDLYHNIIHGRVDEATLLRETGHPNTYTLTKCLAEHVYLAYKDMFPIKIVRPSIISCAWKYPIPGWIDSKAAVAGFVTLIGVGYLKVIDAREEAILDVVPVDAVANDILREARLVSGAPCAWTGSSSSGTMESWNNISIIHSVAGVKRGLPIRVLASTAVRYFKDVRPSQAASNFRKPRLNYLGPRNMTFHMYDISTQRLPLFLAAFYFDLTRKPKMARKMRVLSKVLKKINEVFPYYTKRTFDFEPGVGTLDVNASVGGSEKEDRFTPERYAELICEGVGRNLLKI